ncbi:MAG: S-layer family protein, partial [Cyanobacteria bacterium J06638_38]
NIFSRVTGGDISNIDGLIRANGDANLFLINPAGIVFGKGASLNIGGSFFSSTAESIIFSDDIEFSATDRENVPLLTVNMPIGVNFGSNPGNIAVNGSNLQVDNGGTLALLGGHVTMTGGQIIAPGANIELGGLSEAGKITFKELELISFPEAIARGDVTLTNGAEVNVQASGGGSIGVNARNLELSGGESGASFLTVGIASASGSTEAQAGNIAINATGDIILSQGSSISNQVEESGIDNAGGINISTTNLFLAEGSKVNASTGGRGDAGAITIDVSDDIFVDGEGQDRIIPPSGIFSLVLESGIGDAGEIDITTGNLSLTRGGQVSATTFGQGNAGAIRINALGTISADGEGRNEILPSSISSVVLESGIGNAGEINITTDNLSLTRGGLVGTVTLGQGNAGAITINASGTISADGEGANFNSGIFSTVIEDGIGNSGEINIFTKNLSLTQGGLVEASTWNQGDGGKITINTSDTISVEGEDPDGFSSGIYSLVEESGIGNAGEIKINTNNLSLKQGGLVSTTTLGQGNGGEITIDASGTISIDGVGKIVPNVETQASSGIFSEAGKSGAGNAANIKINANDLFLTNGAGISVQSLGQGAAGNLLILAKTLVLSTKASLFASTPINTGGNIELQIAEEVILSDNSTISAQALEDANGGNLTINAESIVAFSNQNNDIIANAAQGTGGNIDITTNGIFGLEERSSTPPNNTNDIDASSEFGLDGTVEIIELDVNPAEALEEFPVEFIDVARLVAQNLCQQGQGSEFIVTGKGGVVPNPSQARDGEMSKVDLVEPANYEVEAQGSGGVSGAQDLLLAEEEKIIEAQGWIVNDRGILELVAHQTDFASFSPQLKNFPACS